jgi:hypothetical protein
MGMPGRVLAAQDDLLILVDGDGLVLMDKKVTVEYRSHLTAQLRDAFEESRFVAPS